MVNYCRAYGCNTEITSYSRYCSSHKTRIRRHGGATQVGVTRSELKPYIDDVAARISRNPTNAAWGSLDRRWLALADYAQGVIDRAQGRVGVRWYRLAAQEVVALRKQADARAVVEVVLAMYLLQIQRSKRFESDAAFRAQLIRRVRGLAPVNQWVGKDPATGRRKTAQRDLPPKVVAVLGDWLTETLGPGGVFLARMVAKEERERQADNAALAQAFSEVE